MSAQPAPPAGSRPGPSRGLLVAGLVVAVALLVGSVAATLAWAPRASAGTVLDRWDGQERVLGPGWADRMERMHDRMHDDDTPRWWPDEPTPTPSD